LCPREPPKEGREVPDENGSRQDGEPMSDELMHELEHPRGTLVLLLLYVLAIAGMWGYIYLLLLRNAS
jgi:hypothetical protein